MALRDDVSINWSVSPRILGVPTDSIKIQDLVDTCRSLESGVASLAYDHLIDAAGKESLGGEALVGITLVLRNTKVCFGDRSQPVVCSVYGGNLVAVDELGAPMSPIEPSDNVTVVVAQSSSATLIQSGDIAVIKAKTDKLPDDPTSKLDLETTHGAGSWGTGLEPEQLTMLLELYRLMGLDPNIPLVVNRQTRKAGEIEQDFVGDEHEIVVTRR